MKHKYSLQKEERKRGSLLALPSKIELWTFLRVPGMTMPIGDADLDTRGCLCYWEKSAKCGCRPVVVCIPPLNQAHVKALIRILSFGIWFSATSCVWFLNCEGFPFAHKANRPDKIGAILSAKKSVGVYQIGQYLCWYYRVDFSLLGAVEPEAVPHSHQGSLKINIA